MSLFFQLVAAFLVAMIILVLVLIWWIKQKVRKFTASIGKAFTGMTPARIHVETIDTNPFEADRAATAEIESLVRAGFTGPAFYKIRELPTLKLAGLANVE